MALLLRGSGSQLAGVEWRARALRAGFEPTLGFHLNRLSKCVPFVGPRSCVVSQTMISMISSIEEV